MTFVAIGRDWTNVKIPTKASTTYTAGMMLYNDGTNDVPTVDATLQNLRGICLESKANTAATTSISIQVPTSSQSTFLADMESGESLAVANVGAPFDFATGGVNISTASSYDPVTLVKYISASKGVFKFNTSTGKVT